MKLPKKHKWTKHTKCPVKKSKHGNYLAVQW